MNSHIKTPPTLEIQKDFLELIDLIYTVSDRLDVLFLRWKRAGRNEKN